MGIETTNVASNSLDGKLVKLSGDRLTTTCGKGEERNYTVDKEVKVTCDGKEAVLSDLKMGTTIRMSMCKDDKNRVVAIDCGTHIPSLARV